jgi:hypothetical protein
VSRIGFGAGAATGILTIGFANCVEYRADIWMHQSTGRASLFASGLGPTQPGVDPGQPFPLIPAPVNSPVDVTVNGKLAELAAAVGFLGVVDGDRVSFRVSVDTAKDWLRSR